VPAKKTRSVVKKATPKYGTKAANPVYEVRRSRIQGRGGFAIRPIRTGQIIDEYVGQRITHEEADRRYDDNGGRHHTFLFVLDDDTVLDARYGGSDARFLNHSCDPNCETEIDLAARAHRAALHADARGGPGRRGAGTSARGDLNAEMPSMRCVGYRQTWEALDRGELDELPERGIAATRQLAKRQLTWLRGMEAREVLACDEAGVIERAVELARRHADRLMAR